VSRLSLAAHRHDPYWDTDGAAARRVRSKRRIVRMAIWVAVVAALAVIATRLPAVDPEYLMDGGGRPILAGALLTLLAAAAVLALARVRHVSRT
jgi:cobalamin synthase